MFSFFKLNNTLKEISFRGGLTAIYYTLILFMLLINNPAIAAPK